MVLAREAFAGEWRLGPRSPGSERGHRPWLLHHRRPRPRHHCPGRAVVNAGISGSEIRDLMLKAVERRFCPATDVRFQYRGQDLVQTLERICRKVGYPKTIRVDNGSEFISRDLDLRACARQVTLDFSRPGKPTDNGFIEAFNEPSSYPKA